MRNLTPVLLILLTACAQPQTEYIRLRTEIPVETLKPCLISERQVHTVPELAALATEHLRAAECANGKIEAVARIVNKESPEG